MLFWLSLFPIATAWVGENPAARAPSGLCGAVLLMATIAYWILQQTIIAAQGPDSLLKKAVGGDWTGKMSPTMYLAGIAVSFHWPWVAERVYLLVALAWFIPDRRIETILLHGKA